MAPERRKQLVLAALAMVLAGAAYQQWPRATIEAPATSNDMRGAARGSAGKPAMAVPDVHLKALGDERPEPASVERNLFRFKPKPAPPPLPPATVGRTPPVTTSPSGPPPPPAVPPIALKFITLIERPARGSEKIALLSDGRGGPAIYGKEGDIIEGRYKIVRIGTESIEMSYLDGRGRQTIRLSGQ
jgi:hypothetical protein